MAASGWHPAHFTQKTCSFQVKTGLLHPLILKQMRQPLLGMDIIVLHFVFLSPGKEKLRPERFRLESFSILIYRDP